MEPAKKKPTARQQTKVVMDYGKVPPQATEIEESILGALMIDNTAIDKVVDILSAEAFYKEIHQKIYKSITELYGNRNPIDMHTVTEQLRKNGELEEVGGPYAIAMLTAKVASAAHILFHAQIIAQKYMARELIGISTDVQTKAFEENTDVDDLMQEAEGRIFELSQKRQKKGVTQIDPIIDEALARLNKAAAQTDGLSGITSGFHALDKITAGWQKSDLIIIAARPAMGKTAFVLSMARNMAVDYQIPVAVFSLEMSNVQLVNRLIVNVCEIPGEKIKSGQLEPHEWAQLDVKIKKLEGAPIFIDDTPSLSILEFQTKARRLKEEHKVEVIIIDYLQLMNASGMKFQSREQEVSTISRSLKGLAKELDIPIIALSQLNRNVESRGQGVEGKKPQLSDLRESGAIEQDADMVCFIHRPDYYQILEDPHTQKDLRGVAQIIIAKHRNGATGDVDLIFKKEFARFMNEQDTVDPYATLGSKMNTSQTPSHNNYNLPPLQNEDTPF
ncbi:MAG TPA: replicative DNA helicase [Paludibacteraceae bacterium]|nr:replicative DNA helicase [Paludibacteraceae bacterium]